MTHIQEIIPQQIISAASETLLHSLWQAALIAGLLYLLFAFNKRLNAQGRYLAAGAALTAVLLSAIGTFAYLYEPIYTEQFLLTNEILLDETALSATENTSPTQTFGNFLTENTAALFTLYLVGMSVFLLRFLGGFAYVQYLKTQKVRSVSDYWQQKTDALRRSIPVKSAVTLLESSLVKMPVTIGFFKPVILFPLGLIAQLTPAQVEAVLAHELAHIARRDYLFNLLQSVVEVIFYFNPAVWFISGIIRKERENCCDDIALRVTGNPLTYIKTLVNVEEMSRRAVPLAPAFSQPKNLLLMRVQRILNQSPRRSRNAEKFIIGLCLITTVCLFAFQNEPVVAAEIDPLDSSLAVTDTLPANRNCTLKIYKEEDDGSTVEFEIKNDVIKKFVLNGKTVPPADYPKHEKLLTKLKEEAANIPPPPPPPPSFDKTAPPAPPAPPAGVNGNIAPPPPPPPPPPPAPRAPGEQDLSYFHFPAESHHIAGLEAGIEGLESGLQHLEKEKAALLSPKNAQKNADKMRELQETTEELLSEKLNLLQILAEEKKTLAEKRAAGIYPPLPPQSPQSAVEIEAEMLAMSAQEWAQAERERIQAMQEELLLQREDLLALQAHRQGVVNQRREALLQAAKSQRINAQSDRIEAELKKDGFYNGGKYKLKFNEKHLKINGKKQPAAVYKKYRSMLEEMNVSGVKDFEVHIEKTENSRSSSYDFEEEKSQ